MKRSLQEAVREYHREWPRKSIWIRSFRRMIYGIYAKRSVRESRK